MKGLLWVVMIAALAGLVWGLARWRRQWTERQQAALGLVDAIDDGMRAQRAPCVDRPAEMPCGCTQAQPRGRQCKDRRSEQPGRPAHQVEQP